MSCPICNGEPIPHDASVVDKKKKQVILRGKVYAIIPAGYTYSPYKDFATVSLYPLRGKVKYLKFRTDNELKKWTFEKNVTFVVEGCLHVIDGKELVFDITSAERIR